MLACVSATGLGERDVLPQEGSSAQPALAPQGWLLGKSDSFCGQGVQPSQLQNTGPDFGRYYLRVVREDLYFASWAGGKQQNSKSVALAAKPVTYLHTHGAEDTDRDSM